MRYLEKTQHLDGRERLRALLVVVPDLQQRVGRGPRVVRGGDETAVCLERGNSCVTFEAPPEPFI